MQVTLMDIGWQEQIDRLRLTDIGRAVRRMLDDPALVNLLRGTEHFFFLFGQELKVLDGAFVCGDRTPDVVGVLAFFGKKNLQMLVTHHERTG